MRRWSMLCGLAVVVIITALVVATPAEGIVLTGYFTDDNSSIFEGDIDAIAEADIARGCNPPTNTRYCPTNAVDRGAMAAFLRRALNLPAASRDYFTDDSGSIFEGDINAIAEAGIARGCNPPANTRYCPTRVVDRGAMAAFLRRALNLPNSPRDHFTDDNSSIFQADINAIAEADIARGCNPPANTRYCPTRVVDRGAMAAFLRRALALPAVVHTIPVGSHSALSCTKDGQRCSMTVDLSAGRTYRVREGVFQVTPASTAEQSAFNNSTTSFTLTVNGAASPLTQLSQSSGGGVISRRWERALSFTQGNHTLVGTWRWNGTVIQTNTITIRASG